MENKPEPDFLHKTRHDIHSAMHVVIGLSDALVMSDTLAPPQKEIVSVLRKNADRALELIEGIFDFLQPAESRIQELPPVKTSLPAETEQKKEAPNKNMTALLVEDFEPDAMVATSFLKKLGYICDVAHSGEEALEKFSAGHYSVLLIDVIMPGMDGLETTQHIRTLEKKKNMAPTLIIATTGNTSEANQLLCTQAGMNDFLSKPFGLKDLEEKLKNIFCTR